MWLVPTHRFWQAKNDQWFVRGNCAQEQRLSAVVDERIVRFWFCHEIICFVVTPAEIGMRLRWVNKPEAGNPAQY
jgi:cbb3-type cytochrome oxidase subunit 1